VPETVEQLPQRAAIRRIRCEYAVGREYGLLVAFLGIVLNYNGVLDVVTVSGLSARGVGGNPGEGATWSSPTHTPSNSASVSYCGVKRIFMSTSSRVFFERISPISSSGSLDRPARW
jgi:hypothetical protein